MHQKVSHFKTCSVKKKRCDFTTKKLIAYNRKHFIPPLPQNNWPTITQLSNDRSALYILSAYSSVSFCGISKEPVSPFHLQAYC